LSKSSRFILLVTFVVLAASVASRFTASSHADFLGNLNGNVGPGFSISLTTTDGTPVTSLGAGTYAIHVTDQASNHNFHLEGPGVNVATGIADIQTADWTVDLPAGSFTYHCDQHASLTASFTAAGAALPTPPVTADPVITPTPTPAPAPTPTPAPAPVVPPVLTVPPVTSSSNATGGVVRYAGTLSITLTAKDKLVVTKSGKPVTSLDTGKYKLVVTDKSAKRSVMLKRVNGSARTLTSTAFKGKKTIGLDLFGGTWRLYVAGNEKSIFSVFDVSD